MNERETERLESSPRRDCPACGARPWMSHLEWCRYTITPDRYCTSCGGVDNNPTDDEHVCYCERPRGPAARVIAICAACNGEAKTKGGGRPVVVAHAPDCTELQRLTLLSEAHGSPGTVVMDIYPGAGIGNLDRYGDIVAKHMGIPRSNIVIRRIR